LPGSVSFDDIFVNYFIFYLFLKIGIFVDYRVFSLALANHDEIVMKAEGVIAQ